MSSTDDLPPALSRDVACAQARVPGRALALERGVWAGAPGRAAGRTDRALAQVARRRRARGPARAGAGRRRSGWACRRPRPGSCA